MNSRLPIPLSALRALAVVARYGALAPAADHLGVTPGAVSQHIRRAEERCGQTLFERTSKGLVPTAALRAVLPDLRAGFDALGTASAALMGDQGHVLNVTLGTVSASRWLIWRLGAFNRAHPDIEVRLLPTDTLVDLDRPDIDCGIRFGPGDWPGTKALLLNRPFVYPVCAPNLAARLKTPADLAHLPVIKDQTTMLSWSDWLAAAGVPDLVLKGPHHTDPALSFDAAISGQGVLLAVDIMADYAIGQGQLVRPFAQKAASNHSYWFVWARGRDLPARARKFRDWLVATFREGKDGVG